MAIVAVTGEGASTTAVALAAAWPAIEDVLLVEADPTGGDLAAWFDMPVEPSLSTVVTRVLDGAWTDIERTTRLAPNGIRVLPAPAGRTEARQAVLESGRSLAATLASLPIPVLVDAGRGRADEPHPLVDAAHVRVVVHRQATQSARAAAVRLQRLSDQLADLATNRVSLVVGVVGAVPFDIDEIQRFVAGAIGDTPVVGLPVDDLAGAVFGGRTGVSERRLARLPLMRATRDLVSVVRGLLPVRGDDRSPIR